MQELVSKPNHLPSTTERALTATPLGNQAKTLEPQSGHEVGRDVTHVASEVPLLPTSDKNIIPFIKESIILPDPTDFVNEDTIVTENIPVANVSDSDAAPSPSSILERPVELSEDAQHRDGTPFNVHVEQMTISAFPGVERENPLTVTAETIVGCSPESKGTAIDLVQQEGERPFITG